MTTPIEPLRKSIEVPLPQAEAFALFTAGMARWWPLATHSVGQARAVRCAIEPRVGGTIHEETVEGTRHVWGTVRTWEPPGRFVASWHPGRGPGSAQEIELRFVAIASGTRVELEHRGWEALADKALATRQNYDAGWTGVLGLYARAATG